MSVGAAEVLGLPAVDVTFHAPWLRYGLLVLALAWALLVARRGRWAALAGGLLFAGCVLAFWALALPRPYGLFTDGLCTRRLAALSVALATGTREAGPLAGEPLSAGDRVFVELLSEGGPLGATALPFLVITGLGLAVHVLGDRARSGAPALAWLAFSTGDLDAVRGLGLVPGLFARPVESVCLLAVVAGVLVLGRLWEALGRRGAPGVIMSLALGVGVVTAWTFTPAEAVPIAARDLPWILTLDQGPWIVLGLWGLAQGGPPAAAALVGGGALLLAASAAGAPLDPWGSHALYRLGLLLAAARPLEQVAERLGQSTSGLRWARVLAGDAPALRRGMALLVLLCVPVSFLSRWNPRRLDPVYEASLEPVAAPLRGTMAWIGFYTDPQATFLAGPERAAAVAALAGRRVLRAPSLGVAGDDERRLRLERAVIEGRDVEALRRRYGLRYVVAAPGDFREHGLERPEDLSARGLSLLREGAGGLRVYVLERNPTDPSQAAGSRVTR
jgi:hypothetical protein